MLILVASCEITPPPPMVVDVELAVTVVGMGSGNVVSAPAGIDTAAGDTVASFAPGTTVTLQGVAATGSVFDGFELPDGVAAECAGAASCVITLADAVAVTARFGLVPDGETEDLSVVIDGTGAGDVLSVPVGINTASGAFSASFARGTEITLYGVAAPGSVFGGFGLPAEAGVECGGGTTCVITLDATLEVSATFTADVEVETFDRFDLSAETAVAAGQVELLMPSSIGVVDVVSLQPDVMVLRSAVEGQYVRVVWLSESAVSGPQVRLVLDAGIGENAFVLGSVSAFASATAAGVGVEAFTLSPAGDDPAPPGPALPWIGAHDAGVTPVAAFAGRPFGDINGDGVLDVRDAMLLIERAAAGGWSDVERYHADLDGDDVIDADDLVLLLDRLVDPTLPARLNVKPRVLPFVQLDPGSEGPGIVLVANGGSADFPALSWQVPNGAAVVSSGGFDGRPRVLEVSLPSAGRVGWMPGVATIRDGAGDEAKVRLGHLVVLIAGQSNASGTGEPMLAHQSDPLIRMLDNNYVWRNASEPLHAGNRYSFGTRLGELLLDATGYETYLIPTALSGSGVQRWLPDADPPDLFAAARFRGRVSAGLEPNPVSAQEYSAEGGPVNALVWYQGEFDAATSGRRGDFVSRTDAVMRGFRDDLGVPAIFVQLATHNVEQEHVRLHAVAELQRRMETGSGASGAFEARPGRHMVVAFDLPRSDHIHLSAYGLRVLAERIDLAIRQHVLGEDVDGTGPRLRGISHSGTTIRVRTTHTLAADVLDPALFTVFDGAPSGSLDDLFGDPGYGVNTIAITAAVRDPNDATAVRLTLAQAPTFPMPHVRYMGLPNQGPNADGTPSTVWDVFATGIVRAADGGLPLPTFGPLQPFSLP